MSDSDRLAPGHHHGSRDGCDIISIWLGICLSYSASSELPILGVLFH
jgi:hypothetical protein